MGYMKNWTEFEAAAQDLYARSQYRARYCVKFRPRTGKLVLKITDDTTCIMYKTFSSIILNRFEALNARLLSQLANLPKPALPIPQLNLPGTSASASASLLSPPGQAGVLRAGTPLTGEEDEGVSGLSGGEGRAGTPALESGAGAGKGKSGNSGNAGGGGGGKKKKKGKR